MILYKYTNTDGKDIIFNSRLKVNDPNNFNDPFELALNVKEITASDIKKHVFKNKDKLRYYFENGIKRGRVKQSWKDFKKENFDPLKRDQKAQKLAPEINNDMKRIFNQQDGNITNYFLLCCFCGASLKWMDEVLMWAHYSNGLRGLRFSVETESLVKKQKEIEKVQYQEKIIPLYPIGFLTGDKNFIETSIMLSLHTKSKAWEYEQEYRWFADKRICSEDAVTKNWFVSIDLNAVKRIDFGAKCSERTINEISKKVKDLGLKIELKKAVPDEADFKLNYIDL
jgi:hypothetical protein